MSCRRSRPPPLNWTTPQNWTTGQRTGRCSGEWLSAQKRRVEEEEEGDGHVRTSPRPPPPKSTNHSSEMMTLTENQNSPTYPLQSGVNWGGQVLVDQGGEHEEGWVGGLEGGVWNTDQQGSDHLRFFSHHYKCTCVCMCV